MAWSIAEIDNTVTIPKKFRNKVNEFLLTINEGELDEDGKLYFNVDNMEWMDYVNINNYTKGPTLSELLKEIKAKGDITFGSLEGDNRGEFWGYRFDGKGNMIKLMGSLFWEEEE